MDCSTENCLLVCDLSHTHTPDSKPQKTRDLVSLVHCCTPSPEHCPAKTLSKDLLGEQMFSNTEARDDQHCHCFKAPTFGVVCMQQEITDTGMLHASHSSSAHQSSWPLIPHQAACGRSHSYFFQAVPL